MGSHQLTAVFFFLGSKSLATLLKQLMVHKNAHEFLDAQAKRIVLYIHLYRVFQKMAVTLCHIVVSHTPYRKPPINRLIISVADPDPDLFAGSGNFTTKSGSGSSSGS